ncbi:Gfo/Idh/MocA family protein [Gordonibacter massiliensis (ex Traore et al. 2017)]|uniref:Gfo/Idh/MocA family oxidoreductase n=1 Tax=Gordonibacter massiliensis (ex Traore et al. 2017) TaxID=1841863 RepID=A0A842JEP6_9ACTN|nr:Gfo/Idh/MocA family oxidoreductase [Gordonibacter massiliensis (ex Traore et al. 2017)]MBC2889914.1 Gfo/Idh/MocA family oxidoreductase [Gordonibacter massiliensis (ex Traore et al. 2017)]
MRCAIIGCGRIALNHVKAVRSNGFELAALCDVVPGKCGDLLGRAEWEGPAPSVYLDYREMLAAEPGLDIVAVATESGEHARIALDCIDAGKNLIIEKPVALSMADADEIVRRADECEVKVSACHQNRFNVAVQHARRAVEEGRFGQMSHGSIHVRWNRGKSYYEQAPWRGTWAQDGGCLMNQCIHGIDLLRWMMGGEVVSVYAQMRQRFHGYLEAEDVGVAVLSFADGSVATVEGTSNVFPQNLEETLYLFGETGTVKIGGTSTNNVDVWDFADERPEDAEARGLAEPTSNVYGNGHALLYADVAEAVREDRAPYVDARAGRDALEVVLAIYKSQRTGLPVELPLSGFASTDMENEF